MSQTVRRSIPIIMMVSIAVMLFTEYFISVPLWFTGITNNLKSYLVVVTAFALGIGFFNVLLIHGGHIMKRTPDQWPYSVWLIIMMFSFIISGVFFGIQSEQYSYLYTNFYLPTNGTIQAIIGWVLIYAVYSSMRASSIETLYYVSIFLIALLSNTPVSASIWKGFPAINSWLQTVPNTAAVRGFYMANSVSALVMGLRTFTGKTRVMDA